MTLGFTSTVAYLWAEVNICKRFILDLVQSSFSLLAQWSCTSPLKECDILFQKRTENIVNFKEFKELAKPWW